MKLSAAAVSAIALPGEPQARFTQPRAPRLTRQPSAQELRERAAHDAWAAQRLAEALEALGLTEADLTPLSEAEAPDDWGLLTRDEFTVQFERYKRWLDQQINPLLASVRGAAADADELGGDSSLYVDIIPAGDEIISDVGGLADYSYPDGWRAEVRRGAWPLGKLVWRSRVCASVDEAEDAAREWQLKVGEAAS